ncbi:MAG: matrixin family metalloprotease [Nitrososphaerales archaeon]
MIKNNLLRASALLTIAFLTFTVLASPLAYSLATEISLLGSAWDHDNITVYIQLQKGIDSSYEGEVKSAFNDWSNALKTKATNPNAFNFNFLNKPESKKRPADIYVEVRKNTGTILGSATISSSNGKIKEVKIVLAAYNALGLPLGREDFRTIARHEIGHGLGLGHSNDDGKEPLDLMAPTYDFVGVNKDIYPSDLNLNALIFIYGTDGFGGINLSQIPSKYP